MTDAVASDLVRQTLYAADGVLEASDLIRMVLRSSGTGAGTSLVTDDLIRQVLRSTAAAAPPASSPATGVFFG